MHAAGEFDYDLAIIGSGGGAFAAAIAARREDLHVTMVDGDTIGGTCVNVGCIPSKALLAAAETRHRATQGRFPGISTAAGPVDFAALMAGKREIVEAMRQEKYIDLAAEYGIELIDSDARFVEGPALRSTVGTSSRALPRRNRRRAVHPRHPRTGRQRLPHVDDRDGGSTISRRRWSCWAAATWRWSWHSCSRTWAPPSPALASSQLARREEPELAAAVRDAFLAGGIDVVEDVQVSEVRRERGEVVVAVRNREFRAERLLVATGRRPRTDGLGLEAVGVEVGAGGEVVVNDDLSTSNPRIRAAGDVTGRPQFVYVAAKQGSMAVDNAFKRSGRRIDYSALPRITFTNPTIASAGDRGRGDRGGHRV